MAFVDLVGELTGVIPGLSPLLAEKHVNRAWKDIRGERRWTFLQTDGVVVCPAMITAGAVAITQFQSTVTLDATASAAFPADNATPSPTQRQIRFGGSSTLAAGQIYRIMAVDRTNANALVLTLDRVVVESTNAAATYQLYRCYFTAPVADFKGWISFVDTVNGYDLLTRGLRTSQQFNALDPQRTSQGDAYCLGLFRAAGPYGVNSTADPNVAAGTPIYELWPHQTAAKAFYVWMDRHGSDFVSPDDTQPAIIDDALIVARALAEYSYPWAKANVGSFPALKGADWTTLMLSAKKSYADGLIAAKKADDAHGANSVWNRGHGLRGSGRYAGPVDANFIQSHLLHF